MSKDKKLAYMLLFLRFTVFVVMILWTFDKFLNPSHASKVFETFYFMKPFGPKMAFALGSIEFIVVVAFLFGYKKRLSYGLVLLFQAFSTLTYYAQYLAPFQSNHLLYFAAWPMLAACLTLYVLRDSDHILALE